MKGSEKQVKWAEDIIEGARKTIEANIRLHMENAEKFPTAAKTYNDRADQWKRIGAQVEAAVAKCDDAALIINKRSMFSFEGLRKWVDRA